MSNKTQTIAIYRSRTTGEFRIQPFGRLRNGTSQPFGEVLRLPSDVSDDELLKSMIVKLAANDEQAYDRLLLPKRSNEEWRRMLREDQLINVFHSESECRLLPSQRMGNSFGSIDDMARTVPRRDFLERGGAIIRQLFDEIP
jgi:hypothetical protein